MSATVRPASSGPQLSALPIEEKPRSWKDSFTLIRMGVAFFFPWPFLTKRLEKTAERRATQLGAGAARRRASASGPFMPGVDQARTDR